MYICIYGLNQVYVCIYIGPNTGQLFRSDLPLKSTIYMSGEREREILLSGKAGKYDFIIRERERERGFKQEICVITDD